MVVGAAAAEDKRPIDDACPQQEQQQRVRSLQLLKRRGRRLVGRRAEALLAAYVVIAAACAGPGATAQQAAGPLQGGSSANSTGRNQPLASPFPRPPPPRPVVTASSGSSNSAGLECSQLVFQDLSIQCNLNAAGTVVACCQILAKVRRWLSSLQFCGSPPPLARNAYLLLVSAATSKNRHEEHDYSSTHGLHFTLLLACCEHDCV